MYILKKLDKTAKVALISIILSLTIIVNLTSFSIKYLGKASLLYLIGTISSYLLGPYCGCFTLMLGDAIGELIVPHGVFNIFITLTNGFLGLMTGYIYLYLKTEFYIKNIIAYICIAIFFTYTLNIFATIAYYLVLKVKPLPVTIRNKGILAIYLYFLIKRVISQTPWIILNGILAHYLIPFLDKIAHKIFQNRIDEESKRKKIKFKKKNTNQIFVDTLSDKVKNVEADDKNNKKSYNFKLLGKFLKQKDEKIIKIINNIEEKKDKKIIKIIKEIEEKKEEKI